jgi:hypothetical protein
VRVLCVWTSGESTNWLPRLEPHVHQSGPETRHGKREETNGRCVVLEQGSAYIL